MNNENIKVLLINPPSPTKSDFLPLGLGYLGAILEKIGCNVSVIDACARHDEHSIEEVFESARILSPNVIVVTIFSNHAKNNYKLTNMLSKLPSLVVVGGPHPSILPHEVLKYSGANIVVRGEGEDTICDIIEYVKGNMELENIPGISHYVHENEIVDNPARMLIKDLDSIPHPARHLSDASNYDFEYLGGMITSRGCPSSCTFCASLAMGKSYRFRSPQNIINEMLYLRDNYGVNKFFFQDDAFTVNKDRLYQLCNMIIDRDDFNPKWTCVTRVDFITQDMLNKMKEAGCVEIHVGLESGDTNLLIKHRKGISIDSIRRAVRWMHVAGIKSQVNFMFGFPEETVKEIKATENLIKELAPYTDQFSKGGVLIPYPGTEIYNRWHDKYSFTEWWLNDKYVEEYTSADLKVPIFRRFGDMFLDDPVLEFDFFKYSKEIESEIRRGIKLKSKCNSMQHSFIRRNVVYVMMYVSYLLYRINPHIENAIMQPIYTLLSKLYINVLKAKGL